MIFLNNCKAFDHAREYGIADAFFDLAQTGFQPSLATDLSPGETCIVASREQDGRIRFTSYSFSRVEIVPYQGVPWRVFCGPSTKSEVLSKSDAARDRLYSIFFNKKTDISKDSLFFSGN
jgi:hypothetical protein